MKRPPVVAPSHRDIIKKAGGPAALGRKIDVDPNTTKAWNRLDSIPAPHWKALAEKGIATLDDLAHAAAAKVARPQVSA